MTSLPQLADHQVKDKIERKKVLKGPTAFSWKQLNSSSVRLREIRECQNWATISLIFYCCSSRCDHRKLYSLYGKAAGLSVVGWWCFLINFTSPSQKEMKAQDLNDSAPSQLGIKLLSTSWMALLLVHHINEKMQKRWWNPFDKPSL